MKITFIGTGAADWDWELPLKKGMRGSTSTLINGNILVDAGPTVLYRLREQNVNLSQITDVLITHSHFDHYNPENILAIADMPRQEKLNVYASPEALAPLQGKVNAIPLTVGQKLVVGGLLITALPANHAVENPLEATFHFLFEEDGGKRMLYALDGAWMLSATRFFLDRKKLDMVIWDATSGNHRNDWRFADHNELWMIGNMCEAMRSLSLIDEATIHVFDHVAQTLWPEKDEERQELCRNFGGILAEDGMSLHL